MELSAKDVFIVIDVQNDFVSGSMAIAGAEAILEPINALAEKFAHVVVVTDWHPADHISFVENHPGAVTGDEIDSSYGKQRVFPAHCVQDTFGAELDARLKLGKAELIFRKGYRQGVDSYSAIYENDEVTATGLSAYLKARGFTRVFVAGLARYGCVLRTGLGAARDGFTVHLVEDASAGDRGNTPEMHEIIAKSGLTFVQTQDILG